MAKVVVTPAAVNGIERCRVFLAEKNPHASRRAAEAIKAHLLGLADFPEIGRPHDDEPALRELLIPFGNSGYVALYRFDARTDSVVILAFRHQREAGY